MNKEFIVALEELEKSKSVSKEVILEALEKALVKSYQKNYDNNENVDVNINQDSGEIEVYSLKTVVDEVLDPIKEILVQDACKIDSKLNVGDICRVKIAPKNFGRVAAQTARNIVIQKIRDAQRDSIYGEYLDRINEIITGTVQRSDKYNIYVNLDKIEGIIPLKEQVKNETYQVNERIKVLIKDVKNTTKEPQVILSRANENLVVRLFELEVPEITNGLIEIYAIAREAGSRTKMAVFSNDEEIDSVGACIGFKGARVNSIVEELHGEKIDIINYDKDIKTYISNALSPAEIIDTLVNEDKKQSLVVVRNDQLSLAIGKEGQNARLAARLTGWKIDIKSEGEYQSLSQEEIDEILGLNEDEKTEELLAEDKQNLENIIDENEEVEVTADTDDDFYDLEEEDRKSNNYED
ncbi:MAG: transcription termination factor NusA [Peptoniphilaceae bacterium]|nr:transcription termination factor NusA [Peptoniphilaceae bacterium]MDY6019068.1 transcription termination factor NusA [Anaerococcus sp.]